MGAVGALVIVPLGGWLVYERLRRRKETAVARSGKGVGAQEKLALRVAEDDDVEVTSVTLSPSKAVDDERASTEKSIIELSFEDDAEADEATSPVARILMAASGQSDSGKVRKRNEDSFVMLDHKAVYAVADGMGGHAGGDVASKLAIDTFASAFQEGRFDADLEAASDVPRRGREIACAVQMANAAVYERAQSDEALTDMGTTLVSARFSPNKQRVYIGHVGDSRCYRIRGGVIRQLTNDHTLGGLGIKGPTSHQLYQALGLKGRITIDVIVDKPRANDLYLLCSDGLTKMMNDEEIRDLSLAETDVQTSVTALIDLANDRGGKDNVTVILVKVLDQASLRSLRP